MPSQVSLRVTLINIIRKGQLDTATMNEAWKALGWNSKTAEEISLEIAQAVGIRDRVA